MTPRREIHPMQMLQLPWGRMAYTDTGGEGFPLVLLHGTGCDSDDWNDVIAALPDGLRVICMDFRGHGQSETPFEPFTLEDLADDAIALMGRLPVERAALVGHSLGGMAAMAAAARSPRIVGLVLLEGWTNNRACDAYGGARTYGGLDGGAIDRIERKAADTLRRFRRDVWERLAASGAAFDASPYLRRATIPIVEVYGTAGKTAGTEAALQIPANPFITIVWVPDAGHYLPHEKPKETAGICARAVWGLQAG